MAKKVKQPDDLPTIFVDRNLGSGKVVDAIRAAGYPVKVHDDHFAQATPDVEWLAEVGKRGWVVVTNDGNITKNVAELEALIAANVHAVILKLKHPSGNSLASAISTALPNIEQIVSRRPPPTLAIVDAAGAIKPLLGYDQLVAKVQVRRDRLEVPCAPETSGSSAVGGIHGQE